MAHAAVNEMSTNFDSRALRYQKCLSFGIHYVVVGWGAATFLQTYGAYATVGRPDARTALGTTKSCSARSPAFPAKTLRQRQESCGGSSAFQYSKKRATSRIAGSSSLANGFSTTSAAGRGYACRKHNNCGGESSKVTHDRGMQPQGATPATPSSFMVGAPDSSATGGWRGHVWHVCSAVAPKSRNVEQRAGLGEGVAP
jgi:hypothetical protein